MAIWELAVLILSVTYGLVNTIYLWIMIKFMNKFDGLVTKSIQFTESMMDKAKESMSEE